MRNSANQMLAAMSVLALLGGAGCGAGYSDGSETPADSSAPAPFLFYCPVADETVIWDAYGKFVFGRVGDDETGDNLVSLCGWTYYKNHIGGYGGTLEVASFGGAGDGVVFTWAYSTLSAIYLQDGWVGKTDKGIGLGDGLDAFLAAYPDFYEVNATTYMSSDPSVDVTATFSADQTALVSLEIGDYFRM
jgi:hypothetical protein